MRVAAACGVDVKGQSVVACQTARGIGREFEEFHAETVAGLYRFLSSLAYVDRSECDDVAQRAYLAVYRSWAALTDDDHRRALLFTAARHAATDARRRARRRPALVPYPPDGAVSLWATPRVTAATRVVMAYEELPAEVQELLRRRYVDAAPYSQLADETGLTEAATRKRVTRALHAVRQRGGLIAAFLAALRGRLRRRSAAPGAVSTAMVAVANAALVGVFMTAVATQPLPVPISLHRVPRAVARVLDGVGDAAAAVATGDAVGVTRTARRLLRRAPAAAARRLVTGVRLPRLPGALPDGEVGACVPIDGQPTCTTSPVNADVLSVSAVPGFEVQEEVAPVCPWVPEQQDAVQCRTDGDPHYDVPLPPPPGG